MYPQTPRCCRAMQGSGLNWPDEGGMAHEFGVFAGRRRSQTVVYGLGSASREAQREQKEHERAIDASLLHSEDETSEYNHAFNV